MHKILLSIPSKPLLIGFLLVAAGIFVYDLWRRRAQPTLPLSPTPLYLLAAVGAILHFKTGSVIPSASGLAKEWTDVPVYSYGVMLTLSLVIGWFIAMRFARQDGIASEQVTGIYFLTTLWSIVGARLLYVVTNLESFASDPLRIFKVWEGGLVAYGGMIGGFLASWYSCSKRKIPLLRWADVAAPSVVLGTAITRVGCLLYGCDYGARSDVPWAISFPKGSPAWNHHVNEFGLAKDAMHSLPVHPTQVYEMITGLALFGLLVYLRKVRKFSGQVFLGWVLGYGIIRPIIEIFRGDDQRGSVGLLSTSQVIGIASVVFGLLLLGALFRRYKQDPESLRLWQAPATVTGPSNPGVGGGNTGSSGGGKKRRKRR